MLKKLLQVQLTIGSLLALLLLSIATAHAAWSSAIGVMLAMLLNSYVFLRSFSPSSGSALAFIKRFYRAHFVKLGLLGVIVVLMALKLSLVWWAVIIGLLAAQLANLFLLLPRYALWQ